jgi:hypothetical protein
MGDRSRGESGDQYHGGESQRPNEAHANKRPIRDFDAHLRQLYEQQQLAMEVDKEEQERIKKLVNRMTMPGGYEKLKQEKRYYQRRVQSSQGKHQEEYQKQVEIITKAQEEYKKKSENLRKNYR